MMRAGQDYGVRVIQAYENRRVGQVFFPPGILRDRLVRTGFVERVQPPAAKTKRDDKRDPGAEGRPRA